MSKRLTYISPVMGWRFWLLGSPCSEQDLANWSDRISPEEQELRRRWRLQSVVSSANWPYREPLVAQCKDCGPQPCRRKCDCGIYAFQQDPWLERPTGGPYRLWEPDFCVIGQVAGWGRVVLHEEGWRASRAYPQSLALVCEMCLRCELLVRPASAVYVMKNDWFRTTGAVCENDLKGASRLRPETCELFPAEQIEEELLARYGIPRARLTQQAMGRNLQLWIPGGVSQVESRERNNPQEEVTA